MQMRPVAMAAPYLSGPVGGRVSYLLGLDAMVLGDGRLSSGSVSGCLCDLDNVSGGGDTDVSGVDTVVPGAVSGCLCDPLTVSRGDIVVPVGEMSLSGDRGDAVVSGVDEPVCGVSSVMTAGELDVCSCDRLVYDGVGD